MYCTRAKDLWNTPEAKSLLKSVAPTVGEPGELGVFPGFLKENIYFFLNEARHVSLTENDNFLRLLHGGLSVAPSGYAPSLDQAGSNAGDPWPPVENLTSYESRPSGGMRLTDPNILGHISPDDLQRLIMEVGQLNLGGLNLEALMEDAAQRDSMDDTDNEMPELENRSDDEHTDDDDIPPQV